MGAVGWVVWCWCPASSHPALPCFLLLHLPVCEPRLDSAVWDLAALRGRRAGEARVLPGLRAPGQILRSALLRLRHCSLLYQHCCPGRAEVLHLWVRQLWLFISPTLTLVFATKL